MTSPNSFRELVLSGLFLVLALFAEEALHLTRWDIKGEPRDVSVAALSACTPTKRGANYVWCDVPGFGRGLYRCVKSTCYYQEPSAPQRSVKESEEEDAAMGRMFSLDEESK